MKISKCYTGSTVFKFLLEIQTPDGGPIKCFFPDFLNVEFEKKLLKI